MADYSIQLQGFDKAQAAMLRAIEAIKPTGAMGKAVKEALLMAQAYAAEISHEDTGTLARSHRIQYDGASGFVYPSPYNINPKSHKSPAYYAIYEERRGGGHAFYGRTVSEHGQAILTKAAQHIIQAFN